MGVKGAFRKIGRGFKAVGRGFRAAGKAVWRGLTAVFGADAMAKLRDAARALLLSKFGVIVLGIVQELQYENLTNEQKREEALRRILAAAVEQGLELKESFARLLLELAVQALKGLIATPEVKREA